MAHSGAERPHRNALVMTHKCIVPSDDYWVRPRDAFCGEVVEHVGAYVYAADAEYAEGPLCEACLASDDYALYLLGTVGNEPPDPYAGFNLGTVTGRLSSSQPNFSNMAEILKCEIEKMQFDVEAKAMQAILHPADYAALEKAVLEKAGKK